MRDPATLRAAVAITAEYLPTATERNPCDYTPELSRRARGAQVWAAMHSLGRGGLAELFERNCPQVKRFAAVLLRGRHLPVRGHCMAGTHGHAHQHLFLGHYGCGCRAQPRGHAQNRGGMNLAQATPMISKRLGVAAAATLLVAMSACQTVQTTEPGAVGVDRKQRMLVSEQEVEQGAQQAYAEEKKKAQADGKLNSNSALTSRVRNVAQRLIPGTGTFRSDAPNWPWEVNTLTTKELNAYCMPGGKIMVYSGLVEQLKLTDAEMAAVIGHEMAHALREHSRERISRAYAQQIALAGVAVVTGAGSGALDLANSVASVTFQLPH
ncbi:MAG: M48 family metalloprotease, partial [Pseudonocardiaceae bacterium]